MTRRTGLFLELSRPFTLVAPALGVVSGAITAAGAAPREPWSANLIVYPLLGVYALCALGGGYETVREALDRRIAAPGQLVDVGGHRLHLRCAGSGTPTVVLESALGETGGYWEWISPAIAREKETRRESGSAPTLWRPITSALRSVPPSSAR